MHSQLDHAIANATGITAAVFYGCKVETVLLVLFFLPVPSDRQQQFQKIRTWVRRVLQFCVCFTGATGDVAIFPKIREGSALLNVLHHPLRRRVMFIFIFFGQIVTS